MPPDECFIVIRPPGDVGRELARVARQRRMVRAEFIVRLLAVVVRDKLVDKIFDDDESCLSSNQQDLSS